MANYYFSNYAYLKDHGKAPRGTGHWAFLIENAVISDIAPETFIDEVNAYQKDTIFWVPGVMSLSEAKKAASKMLRRCNVPTYVTVYIAP